MILSGVTLNNSALLVVDVINSAQPRNTKTGNATSAMAGYGAWFRRSLRSSPPIASLAA